VEEDSQASLKFMSSSEKTSEEETDEPVQLKIDEEIRSI
jgi:hypothetical protein